MSASLRRKSVESREHGVAFARAVFNGADKNGDGTLTKTEVRKYFKANPEDKVSVCHFHPTPTHPRNPHQRTRPVWHVIRDVWCVIPVAAPFGTAVYARY